MHVPVHDGWYLFSSSGSGARHSHGLRSIGRPDLATLVLAVIRGLLMDLDATGDTTRADRAFRDFLGAVEHLSSGYRSGAVILVPDGVPPGGVAAPSRPGMPSGS